MQASKDRSGDITRALLSKGADVGAKNSTGSTPLHRCQISGFRGLTLIMAHEPCKACR